MEWLTPVQPQPIRFSCCFQSRLNERRFLTSLPSAVFRRFSGPSRGSAQLDCPHAVDAITEAISICPHRAQLSVKSFPFLFSNSS